MMPWTLMMITKVQTTKKIRETHSNDDTFNISKQKQQYSNNTSNC